jgi:hypothetical protein
MTADPMARIHHFPVPDLSNPPTYKEMLALLRYDRLNADTTICECIGKQPEEQRDDLFVTYFAAKLEAHGDPHNATALRAAGLPPPPSADVITFSRLAAGKSR